MQSPISLWQQLDTRKKLLIAGATAAMFAAILLLARMGGAPQMALLYAGLDPQAAGDVVAALERQGVSYDIAGDSIRVPEADRDRLRMTLAAEGLPANSGAGYELLDGLSGFGTTTQIFDAAYWRAKEGELARTILANPAIRAARVHIARQVDQPFSRQVAPTASVTVTTATGGPGKAQAQALRHLVAAAVPGMRPADVAIIDAAAGLIGEDDAPDLAGDARAAEIRGNVERLLAAHVGPGKSVVEVAVDLVTEREAITERRFDPQGRVAISSENEEKSGSSTDPGGAVTVASNLPDGAAAPGASGQSRNSETRERVNYEVSEVRREVLRNPGSVRKLSVAVLVDGKAVTAADGTTTIEPRSDAELATLRELVASAVGMDISRGDTLVIKSLVFEASAPEGTVAEAGMPGPFAGLDMMTLIQIAVLAVVALILGLFVLRPVLMTNRSPEPDLPPVPQLGPPDDFMPMRVLTGEIDEGGAISELPVVSREGGEAAADPVARLRRLIEERQTESLEILRGWMEQGEERA